MKTKLRKITFLSTLIASISLVDTSATLAKKEYAKTSSEGNSFNRQLGEIEAIFEKTKALWRQRRAHRSILVSKSQKLQGEKQKYLDEGDKIFENEKSVFSNVEKFLAQGTSTAKSDDEKIKEKEIIEEWKKLKESCDSHRSYRDKLVTEEQELEGEWQSYRDEGDQISELRKELFNSIEKLP